jgi:transcriptional regulator with XRE-family HTH domain
VSGLLPDEEALLKELGHTLKAARKQAGLLQRELAHKIGYSRTSIANAEAGITALARDFYERIDVVLGTSLARGNDVLRVLRAERREAKRAAGTGPQPDEFAERCDDMIKTLTLRIPEQHLKIILEIRVLENPS